MAKTTDQDEHVGRSPTLTAARQYEESSERRPKRKGRCCRRPDKWLKEKVNQINAEAVEALDEKLKQAAIGCYQSGGRPPTVEKTIPFHLRFSPPIAEQIYVEWRSIGDRLWEIAGFSCAVILILYYWFTDWIDSRDPDNKVYRVASRGALFALVLCIPWIIPARTGKAVWRQQRIKLALMCIILVLKFVRILFEINTLLYTRSMAIWGTFMRVILVLGCGLQVDHFLTINCLSLIVNLVWHYVFRPFSEQHVFQWEIVVFVFFQLQYYLIVLREREDFRRRTIAYMERKVSEELAAVHEFVAHHSRDVIALHSIDAEGYHCFKFVSSSIEAMTGWSSEELTGRRVVDFVHDQDKENVERILSVASLRHLANETLTGLHDEGTQWNLSYVRKLEKIQRKFSDVLNEFSDSVLDTTGRANTSARVAPEDGTHINLEFLHRRKRKQRFPKDSAEAEWSEAVTTHDQFTKLFSKGNITRTPGLDEVYRQSLFTRSWSRRGVSTNTEAREVSWVLASDHHTKEFKDEGHPEHQGSELCSDENSPRIPGTLQYYSAPSATTETSSFLFEDEVEGKLLEPKDEAANSMAKSVLSSLPSLAESDLDEPPLNSRPHSAPSISFRMISKSGTMVHIEASCNWTPQGVVAVYRDTQPRLMD